MELKEIISRLNEELKKDIPDKKIIVSNINSLIHTYKAMISSLKAESSAAKKVDELEKKIKVGEKKYKKKVIDLYTIFEVAKDLSSSLNIDNLIKNIILTSMGHMLSETGVVFVLDEKFQRYVFKDVKGIKEDLSDIKFDANEELINYIITKEKPISKKEITDEPFGTKYNEIFKRLNVELLVPIIFKKKLNGILFLGPKPGGMAFTESNLEFLVALGNFAAIAIENAKLYDDLDKKVKDLSALYDISKEINKSEQLDIVLDLMLETITTGFGVKKCSIILYNELKNIYRFERNYNISEEQAKKYWALIQENKIENPLDKNEPVILTNSQFISDNDIFFCIPLIAGSRKVGVLNIYQFEESVVIDDNIKQIFSIIASQMAPPILLTQYFSKSDIYKENPYDYIYNKISDMTIKSKETGINFIVSRIKFFSERMNFKLMKEFIEKIKTILQETDILIHSNFDELILIFPATPKEDAKNLLDNFIPSITDVKIKYNIVSFPEEAESIEKLLAKLYV